MMVLNIIKTLFFFVHMDDITGSRRELHEKQIHKNTFAYEVRAVLEGGEHGGSQRWQLTIIHLA